MARPHNQHVLAIAAYIPTTNADHATVVIQPPQRAITCFMAKIGAGRQLGHRCIEVPCLNRRQ